MITNFKAIIIKPEEYRHFRHSSARAAEKDPENLVLYYSTFRYKGQVGYMYKLVTKKMSEDSNVDLADIIKAECLEWAQANYGEV